MRMIYGIAIDDLSAKCGRCEGKFTIAHAIQCKEEDLVVGSHNKIKNEL